MCSLRSIYSTVLSSATSDINYIPCAGLTPRSGGWAVTPGGDISRSPKPLPILSPVHSLSLSDEFAFECDATGAGISSICRQASDAESPFAQSSGIWPAAAAAAMPEPDNALPPLPAGCSMAGGSSYYFRLPSDGSSIDEEAIAAGDLHASGSSASDGIVVGGHANSGFAGGGDSSAAAVGFDEPQPSHKKKFLGFVLRRCWKRSAKQ